MRRRRPAETPMLHPASGMGSLRKQFEDEGSALPLGSRSLSIWLASLRKQFEDKGLAVPLGVQKLKHLAIDSIVVL